MKNRYRLSRDLRLVLRSITKNRHTIISYNKLYFKRSQCTMSKCVLVLRKDNILGRLRVIHKPELFKFRRYKDRSCMGRAFPAVIGGV